MRYCEEQQIDFTRGRAYRKNDNNFTEQKNFDVVRKHVGYVRYDTAEAVALLNELYDRLRLMVTRLAYNLRHLQHHAGQLSEIASARTPAKA